MNKPESFEKFYYAKVGLGEGCGCAERIIDVHEVERTGGVRGALWRRVRPRFSWRGFLCKYGLSSRPAAPD